VRSAAASPKLCNGQRCTFKYIQGCAAQKSQHRPFCGDISIRAGAYCARLNHGVAVMFVFVSFMFYPSTGSAPKVIGVFSTFERAVYELQSDRAAHDTADPEWNHMNTDMEDVEMWETPFTTFDGSIAFKHIHKIPFDKFTMDLAESV
jgi:hypothetical protein